MILNYLLLQEPSSGAGGTIQTLLFFAFFIAVFYFFFIRPQTKRQKEIKKFREALKAGDAVITAGGIYGKIRDIKDKYMLLEIADGVKIKVDKSMIYPSAADANESAAGEQK